MKNRSTASFGCFLLAIGLAWLGLPAVQAQSSGPKYEVDTSWPKPWPERWVIGPIGAVCVDAQDHVLILNRQEVLDVDLDAGTKAPPVMEVDQTGKVVHSWGDGVFNHDEVDSFHSCHFDADNNVWVVSNDSGAVKKFSHDGKLLLTVGTVEKYDSSDGTRKGKELNSDAAVFFVAADIGFDKSGDIYVDDGDGPGNHRIAVLDRTGKFLRQWKPPGVRSIHCMALADDGLVYICDRDGNRVQVFDRMGVFKKNIDVPWKRHTPIVPGDKTKRRTDGTPGTAVSIALSRDKAQQYIYAINQNNSQIDILDRQSGKVVSSFGRSGHLPGQFDQPLNIAVDSKSNLYVTENRGKRIQKFKLAQ